MPRRRRMFLPDVQISIFEQAPELPDEDGNRPSLESRMLSQDYAHRVDVSVSESEISGDVQAHDIRRRYIVRRDEVYTVEVMQRVGPLGSEPLGKDAMGEQPIDFPPVARTGANARAGLLLRDDETGEFFDISGIKLNADNQTVTIVCAARRGNP